MLFITHGLHGQKRSKGERRAELIEKKKAYISESISLKTEEVTAFWELYDDYHMSRQALMKKKKRKRGDKDGEIDDAKAEEMLDIYLSEKQQEMTLHINYLKEMRQLLGAKRVLELEKVERRFNRDVLETLRTKRRGKKSKNKG